MIQITYHEQTKYLPVKDEKSILELVRESFECSFSPCPKSAQHSGSCGRCACLIRTQSEATSPALACRTIAKDGMVVECHFVENYDVGKVQIVDRVYGMGSDEEASEQVTAVDLGSTTIAMRRGLYSYTCMNPQRAYGCDVISRIAAATDSNEALQDMMRKTRDAIAKGLLALDETCRDELNNAVTTNGDVVLAGNTTMIHLLMGHDCKELGVYPFTSSHLASEQVDIYTESKDLYHIRTLPGMSAFVGGDIVSGLLFIENADNPENDSIVQECYLMIDLGTNGELVLKKNGTYYATSTAAGPAFEGDATANLPGTDMIRLVAQALKNNTLERNGYLTTEDSEVSQISEAGEPILRQKHVRDIQLAKAAVYTGIVGLMKETNTSFDEINRVYLAGGFGYFLNPEDAFTIRLLPEEFRGKVQAIGNSSLGGAALLVKKPELWDKVKEIAEHSVTYSAAEKENFGEDYIRELNF